MIINLPSVEVPSAGTLTLLVTHRFVRSLQEGNINNFFTLDTGNTWGFGLWYAPVKNLNVGFYRSSDLNTYEASAQYQLPIVLRIRVVAPRRRGLAHVGRATAATPKSSFFAQAILAYSFGQYVRLTAVPTYLQRTNGINAVFRPHPFRATSRAFSSRAIRTSLSVLGTLRKRLQRPGRRLDRDHALDHGARRGHSRASRR